MALPQAPYLPPLNSAPPFPSSTGANRATVEAKAPTETRLYPNYGRAEIVLERGKGARLWDTTGRQYLDLYAGIAVNTLGHDHPELTHAIADQAAKLVHISNHYYSAPNIELAARLCALTGMARAFFCNSGTEANEALLKLARRYYFARGETERYEVLAFTGSFHGRTLGSLAATGQSKYREGFGPLAGVTHVPYGDLEAVRKALTPRVAAILVEPILGEGGVILPPAGFLEGLRALCDEHGCLLLADEIQTGVGRTGKFLGFDWTNVRPDALSLAKGLGGGVPIGAMLCRTELETALPPGSHGTTFGGNPLASRAALAVLAVLTRDDLMGNVVRLGTHLATRLAAFSDRYAAVQSTRGQGFLQALELAPHIDPNHALALLRDKGVLVTIAGGNALRFTPPLILTEEELEQGLDALREVLEELSR